MGRENALDTVYAKHLTRSYARRPPSSIELPNNDPKRLSLISLVKDGGDDSYNQRGSGDDHSASNTQVDGGRCYNAVGFVGMTLEIEYACVQ